MMLYHYSNSVQAGDRYYNIGLVKLILHMEPSIFFISLAFYFMLEYSQLAML